MPPWQAVGSSQGQEHLWKGTETLISYQHSGIEGFTFGCSMLPACEPAPHAHRTLFKFSYEHPGGLAASHVSYPIGRARATSATSTYFYR